MLLREAPLTDNDAADDIAVTWSGSQMEQRTRRGRAPLMYLCKEASEAQTATSTERALGNGVHDDVRAKSAASSVSQRVSRQRCRYRGR